jgi:CBS domain-containing protein
MNDVDKPTTAADVMTRSLVCCKPDDELKNAEEVLIEHRISGMPVVVDGKLVGVLSRSDIARMDVLMRSLDGQVSDRNNWNSQADGFEHSARAEYQGFRSMIQSLKVRDAMNDQVVTCAPTSPILEVAEEMVRHHIHRVIVVRAGEPIGIVSSFDIVKLVAQRGLAPAAS